MREDGEMKNLKPTHREQVRHDLDLSPQDQLPWEELKPKDEANS